MPTTSKRIITSAPRPDDLTAQTERLTRHMQRIHNHDLPNQIVALQSLLQLLAFEEAQNFSEDGREYVRRLQNAARRTSDLVRYLKDISKLSSFTCTTETIELANLSRELQGELQRQFPDKPFSFDWQWDVPTIAGDPRAYVHALIELCKASFVAAANQCTIRAHSRQRGAVVEVVFQIHDAINGSNTTTSAPAFAERMEVVLAREWLAACGAALEIKSTTSAATEYVITVPV